MDAKKKNQNIATQIYWVNIFSSVLRNVPKTLERQFTTDTQYVWHFNVMAMDILCVFIGPNELCETVILTLYLKMVFL